MYIYQHYELMFKHSQLIDLNEVLNIQNLF